MLRGFLEVIGSTKFKEKGVTEAPPPGKDRDEWNASRMARADDLLAIEASRLKSQEVREFIYKLDEITGPIEAVQLAPKVKSFDQKTRTWDAS